jgi:hypothetical protein
MLFKGIIYAYSENYIKSINTLGAGVAQSV